jgi:HAMP domain-containing protein
MTLRLKLTLALVAASLFGVLISFAVMFALPEPLLAGTLAAALAAALVGAVGYLFAGSLAHALSDLHGVIHRFIKWDMDGLVPHASRHDEVGDIAKALKAFQADAIQWSASHKSE